jgi:hypothetical protein
VKGYAPRWQVRCTKCGRTRDASDVGIIRIGATGKSYALGWCSNCRWLRFIAIEKNRSRQMMLRSKEE